MNSGNRMPRGARWGTCAVVLALVMLLLVGCSSKGSAQSTTVSAPSTPTIPATTSSPPLTASSPVPTGTANDLKNNSAHHTVAIDGEKFLLKVDYWTTIDASTWGAMGTKDVHLLAYVDPAAGATPPSVVVDEFDSVFSLMAANPGLDGVTIGNFSDRASSSITGFLITPTISYGTAVPNSGISAALAQRWQFLAGSAPLTEAALQRAGVYAIKVSFTYLLLVRNAGDSGWHRRTVLDELTVPVRSVQVTTTTATSTTR
jgi:hypothetical protein